MHGDYSAGYRKPTWPSYHFFIDHSPILQWRQQWNSNRFIDRRNGTCKVLNQRFTFAIEQFLCRIDTGELHHHCYGRQWLHQFYHCEHFQSSSHHSQCRSQQCQLLSIQRIVHRHSWWWCRRILLFTEWWCVDIQCKLHQSFSSLL